jgi:hypothetical protein
VKGEALARLPGAEKHSHIERADESMDPATLRPPVEPTPFEPPPVDPLPDPGDKPWRSSPSFK